MCALCCGCSGVDCVGNVGNGVQKKDLVVPVSSAQTCTTVKFGMKVKVFKYLKVIEKAEEKGLSSTAQQTAVQ